MEEIVLNADNQSLKDEVMKHEAIWSLMYSPDRNKNCPIEEDIIELPVSLLDWCEDGNAFYYQWGWPGCDINKYTWSTFGTGWTFSREALIKNWQ